MNQSNLKKLQNLLKEKDIDIFVINRSDEYLNEYISPNAERLNFITKRILKLMPKKFRQNI